MYARGNNHEPLFRVSEDRHQYFALLEDEIARRRWLCLAYCLMDNHLHLLIETPQRNLGAGMQQLHGDYGQNFNAAHKRDGHVFQGRYGSVLVKTEMHFWIVVAYIAANPVEAGVCARPEDWPWSSHGDLARGAAPSWLEMDRLLARFGTAGGEPWLRYHAAVAERCARP